MPWQAWWWCMWPQRLKHQFIDRDGLLQRMLPGKR